MRRSILLLVLATVVGLGAFAHKAFHMDDPLFLWAARHIQSHPADPYGFTVNWYSTEMPMADVTRNPPLAAYYIAGVAAMVGWSETALHLAFLIPAGAVAVGVFLLARRLCGAALLASLFTLTTPAFMVSSSTVMGDTLMLAFWVWAVLGWVEGLERNRHGLLAVGALLMALAALTKYFGVCLIPLLLAYSAVRKKGVGVWALHFLIPVAMLVGYEAATRSLYGHGLLWDAASYASWVLQENGMPVVTRSLTTLSFVGGAEIAVLCCTPLVWSRRVWAVAAVGTVVVALAIVVSKTLGGFELPENAGQRALFAFQFGVFVVAGVSVLALAILDVYERRDAGSTLLALWILGTFAFAAYLNWTVNGRSVLPLMPAAGIVLVRRIERRFGEVLDPARQRKQVAFALVAAGLISLAVAHADYRVAGVARNAARVITHKYSGGAGRMWFEGHWGFQYYMESLGGRPLEADSFKAARGDVIVVPHANANLFSLPPECAEQIEELHFWPLPWLTTVSRPMGARFYFSGPLPFAFGRVPVEKYHVLRCK